MTTIRSTQLAIPVLSDARARVMLLAAALGGIAAAHHVVGVANHGEHVLHLALEFAFLLPVVAGAAWFGVGGGVVAAAAAAFLLASHALWSWSGQPMQLADQFAMALVYLAVGGVAGALVAAQERERKRRLEVERRATRDKVVEGLAALQTALGFRDEATRGHGNRVAALAVRLGRRVGLGAEELDRLRLAALVHDLGKIGVRDDILLKRADLTAEERFVVDRHPALAADILRQLRGAERIADVVLCHHERLDGSGYPRGLSGTAIPLEARVLAVADVYCALAEPRPYKPVLATATILALLEPLAGKSLDAGACAALRLELEAEQVPEGDRP